MGLQKRKEKNSLHGSKKVRAARDRARALRAKHGLCVHNDDERAYSDEAASKADQTSAAICDQCGKPRLIVKVIDSGFVGGQAIASNGVAVPAELLVNGLLK